MLATILVLLLPEPASAQLQVARPDASYRTFDTDHFRVVYVEGLEEVARRAARHAEEAHRTLTESFFPPPDRRIEILVTDHNDVSNGFAMVAPSPRMILWVRPPMDGTALSHFDDWIRVVTVHELAHVFHLEHTGPLGRISRKVFGRAPRSWPFFTGFYLPRWAVEGVAVQIETAHTDGGRIHGTAMESTVRAQALEDRVETLGQAMGSSPVWPGGNRPYVFGSLFFHWLHESYGPEASREFLQGAADQWIPFRLDAAARRATGRSLQELWEEWRDEVSREAREAVRPESDPAPEVLIRGARQVSHPTPRPGSGDVAYIRADGRTDTRIVLRDAAGAERTLAVWNSSQAPPSWSPDGTLVATQVEFVDRWSVRQDLYRVALDGRVERLTRDRRIAHAHASPRSGEIVATQEGEGTNRLVLLDAEGELVEVLRDFDPGVHWAHPQWSPDGGRIAVIRWREGGWTGVAIMDRSADAGPDPEPFLLHEDRAVNSAPTWSPDGRWVVWAGDRDGAYNLLAREVGAGGPVGGLRQASWTATGATHPAVDGQGRWMYYVVQGADGWDLVRAPFDPASWRDPAPPRPRFVAGGGEDRSDVLASGPVASEASGYGEDEEWEDRPWSPLSSLLPRYWLPEWFESESVGDHRILPWVVAIQTSGQDVVRRHTWDLSVGVGVPEPGRRTELRSRWRWAGLGQPQLTLDVAQQYRTMGAASVPGVEGDTVYPVARERRLGIDADLVRRRMRSTAQVGMGVREVWETREIREADGETSTRLRLTVPERRFTELRAVAAVSSVRRFPFSVSAEEGASLTVQARRRFHRALADSLVGIPGLDGSFTEGVVVARGFRALEAPGGLPSFSRAGVGVRVVGGMASGPGAGTHHFLLGGGGGGGDGPARFTYSDANPLFSVRGYPRGIAGGDRAWAASAEVRLPLANLHRGFGALPLHLDRMAGGLFADVAGARSTGPNGALWEERASVGVELSLIHSLFFETPDQVRVGVALPLVDGDGPGLYLQSGWSF